MSKINFNYAAVYGCAAKVRETADTLSLQGAEIKKLTDIVVIGWIGAGAEEYISYLQSLYGNISARVQKLYEIADALYSAAGAAAYADAEAARAVPGSADSAQVTDAARDSPVQNNSYADSTAQAAAKITRNIISVNKNGHNKK